MTSPLSSRVQNTITFCKTSPNDCVISCIKLYNLNINFFYIWMMVSGEPLLVTLKTGILGFTE